MATFGQSYWIRGAKSPARSARSAPALKGHQTADVVVIGGGFTGCLTAWTLAEAGLQVVLLEADTLVSGATQGSLGAVLPTPDVAWSAAKSSAGVKPATIAFREVQRAARDLPAAMKKARIAADLSPMPLLVNAPFTNDAAELRKEIAARKAARLDGVWIAPSAAQAGLVTETQGAMRLKDALALHPVKAAHGYAAAASRRGARLIEGARVRKTQFTRKDVTVVLSGGASITARGVVVATGEPGQVFAQLQRHVRVTRGYVVVTAPLSATMRRGVGAREALYTEFTESPRWLRWLPDHRAMFAGLATPPPADGVRNKATVQRCNQLMYELSLRHEVLSGLPPAWGWDVPVVTTADGLPWIGPHRNYPFHFFAMAFGWHGEAWAWVAAQAALRHFTGKATKDDALLGFTRAL